MLRGVTPITRPPLLALSTTTQEDDVLARINGTLVRGKSFEEVLEVCNAQVVDATLYRLAECNPFSSSASRCSQVYEVYECRLLPSLLSLCLAFPPLFSLPARPLPLLLLLSSQLLGAAKRALMDTGRPAMLSFHRLIRSRDDDLSGVCAIPAS